MKMKTISLSMLTVITVSSHTLNAQSYKVDTKNSTLQWHRKKVTGEHFGFISLKDGEMVISNDQITMQTITHPVTFVTEKEGKAYSAKIVVDRSKAEKRMAFLSYGSSRLHPILPAVPTCSI
jgi:hypothetical protein